MLPRLIKAETVAKMKPGSVILDMAVETVVTLKVLKKAKLLLLKMA